MAGDEIKPAKEKSKGGRPTDYNDDIAALICERVATSTYGLNQLCNMYDDMPNKTTVNLWRFKHHEFSTLYARAKLFQADLLAEECIEIADEKSNDEIINPTTGAPVCNSEYIARSRLRIDTRKWLAAKLLPKQYGKAAEEPEKVASTSETIIEKLIDRLTE